MSKVVVLTQNQYDELVSEFESWAAESGTDREIDYEARREELEFEFIDAKLGGVEWEVEDADK